MFGNSHAVAEAVACGLSTGLTRRRFPFTASMPPISRPLIS
ncbi:MAG: hypothetical protein R2700_06375 [Solirubrobacterales bacterium]